MRVSKDLFDDWAINYDEYLKGSPFYETLINNLTEIMDLNSSHKVLDIGIGTGNVSFRLIKKYGCKIVGIDISEKMLQECKKNALAQEISLECKMESIEKTSFESGIFDSAVAAFSLHHIPDKKKLSSLRELNRILKVGGRVGVAEVVVDIDGELTDKNRLKHILERWGYAALVALENGGPDFAKIELEAIRTVFMKEGEYLVPKDMWISIFEKAGFSIISTECTNKLLGHWIILCEKTS